MQDENRWYHYVLDLMKKTVGQDEGSPTPNIWFVLCNVHMPPSWTSSWYLSYFITRARHGATLQVLGVREPDRRV